MRLRIRVAPFGGSVDTTPDQFNFSDVTGAALATEYTSDLITVSGIASAAAISVIDGTYSVDGGTYTATAGSVNNGDTVKVRGTSSGSNSTAVNVVLTIGGVSDTFSITTAAGGGSAGQMFGFPFPITKAA